MTTLYIGAYEIYIRPAHLLEGFLWAVYPLRQIVSPLESGRANTEQEAKAQAEAWIARQKEVAA